MKARTCDLCEDLSPKIVRGIGPTNPKLIILGSAPDEDDERKGFPQAGGKGKVFSATLGPAGLQRSELYITNVVKCRPSNNRKPTRIETANCFSTLKDELRRINCKTIVTLGDYPTKSIVNTGHNISKIRGTPMYSSELRCDVIPTFDPKFLMQGKFHMMGVVINDLKKALSITNGVEIDPPVDYLTDPHSDEGRDYIERCIKNGCSCDIESTGLDPYNGSVIGVSFSVEPRTALYCSFNLHESTIRKILNSGAPITFQYGQFDTYFLKVHGVRVRNWAWDTKYAQNLIAPELPASLAFLNSIYTMYPYYKEYGGTEIRKNIAATPKDVLQFYCNRDADVTEIARIKLKEEVESNNLDDVMNNITMPLARAVVGMRINGIKLDLDALQKWKDYAGPNTEILKDWFEKLGVNPNSGAQVGRYMIDALNISLGNTPTGKPKTDAKTIKSICARYEHPFLDNLLKYREVSKINSTYVETIERFRHGDRLRSELVVGGAETGRLSSRDPNLQNVPESLRNIFIPETNHTLIDADYTQLEMYVLAALSGDILLHNDLNNGVYVPTVIGQSMGWSVEECQLKKKILKGVMYGTLYGRGARAIAIEFGLKVAEAQSIQNSFLDRYPDVKEYLYNERATANRDKKITTPFGRYRHFVGPRAATQSFNYKIQSCASDIMSTTLIQIYNTFPHYTRLSVHDSVILTSPKNQLTDVRVKLKTLLQQPIPQMWNKVFPADIKVGQNWRDVA